MTIFPQHPGIELGKRIQASGMNLSEFARSINVSPSRISELVAGKRALSIDSAYKIAQAFGTPVSYWMRMQMEYEIFTKELNEAEASTKS